MIPQIENPLNLLNNNNSSEIHRGILNEEIERDELYREPVKNITSKSVLQKDNNKMLIVSSEIREQTKNIVNNYDTEEITDNNKSLAGDLNVILDSFMNQMKMYMSLQLGGVKEAINKNSKRIDLLFQKLDNNNGSK